MDSPRWTYGELAPKHRTIASHLIEVATAMNLDVDVGNSRIKWRLSDSDGSVVSGSQATSDVAAGHSLALDAALTVSRVRIASVADSEVLVALCKQFYRQYAVVSKVAQVSGSVGPLVCAYEDCQSLGVDRWLALVAAYQRFNQALLVVDAGSAITMDLLSSDGQHLGGFIIPGLRLMCDSLWRDTSGVRVAGGDTQGLLLPGKDTQQAVNRGCVLAAVATIEKLASQYPVRILLTGGDAEVLMEALSLKSDHCPDLVLDGLSVDEISFVDGPI